jgi:hypothetical protein
MGFFTSIYCYSVRYYAVAANRLHKVRPDPPASVLLSDLYVE